ncbi:MAG: hypothetical protein ACTSRW_09080 [Candidatus Helarchaeota archaeon]
MNINEVLKFFKDSLKQFDVIVSPPGFLSQSLFRYDRPGNFYMTADFGNCITLSLGLALNLKNRIFVLQETRDFLNNLGTIHALQNYDISNLILVLFDFQIPSKSSNQFFVSSQKFEFLKVLKSMGFEKIYKIQKAENLHGALKKMEKNNGVSILYIQITEEDLLPPLIISLVSLEIKNRFMKFLIELDEIPDSKVKNI